MADVKLWYATAHGESGLLAVRGDRIERAPKFWREYVGSRLYDFQRALHADMRPAPEGCP